MFDGNRMIDSKMEFLRHCRDDTMEQDERDP